MGGEKEVYKVLGYLSDNTHRWAGANPERGPTHRGAGDWQDKIFDGINKSLGDERKEGIVYLRQRLF
jgi:hypothetical protein